MTFRSGRTLILALAMAATATACAPIRTHQGYLVDDVLVASVKPGIDNRASVQGTLGRPSFTGQFDQRDWYYVSRDTRALAFNMPKPAKQTVLHVRFDDAGNVTSVERTGLERVAKIDPTNAKTPTLGRRTSLFEEIFGNIGQVGTMGAQGQAAPTPDNPQ